MSEATMELKSVFGALQLTAAAEALDELLMEAETGQLSYRQCLERVLFYELKKNGKKGSWSDGTNAPPSQRSRRWTISGSKSSRHWGGVSSTSFGNWSGWSSITTCSFWGRRASGIIESIRLWKDS